MLTGPIINKAWAITKHYKSLWVLGAFAGSIPTWSFQWDMSKHQTLGGAGLFPESIGTSIALIMALLVLGLIFAILYLICSAGLIDAVNRIARGGQYKLGTSFSIGVDYFWRFLGIFILYIFAFIVMLLALAIPGAICFWINILFGFLSLVVLIPAGIVGFFVMYSVYELTRRAVVTRNVGIGDAVEEAWYLFRHNLATNAIFALVVLGLSLLIGLVFLVILGALAAPFVAIAFIQPPPVGLILALVLGIPVLFLVLILFNGVFGTFMSAIYTLFYFELLQPGQPITAAYPGQPPVL